MSIPAGPPQPPLLLLINGVEFWVAPADRPPFRPGTLVEEQDRYLMLACPEAIEEPLEGVSELQAAAVTQHPLRPGTVSVRPGRPLRLVAITHDLDATPICRREWVDAAYGEITLLARRHRLRTLALPLLGTRYHSLTLGESLRSLLPRLLGRVGRLRRVWLQVEVPRCGAVLALLREATGAP